jgi:hypothetical protein
VVWNFLRDLGRLLEPQDASPKAMDEIGEPRPSIARPAITSVNQCTPSSTRDAATEPR